MPHGYNGKILIVDLGSRTWTEDCHDEKWYRTYWGGGLLASWYLQKMTKPNCKAFGADNVLVFAASVLCGAPLSGFSRYTVAAISPQTGCFGEAEAGGYFGPALKHAGYDAVVFKGQASSPVYLLINKGKVELCDASKIWGLDLAPAQDAIRAEVGDKKARVAGIGRGGENKVKFACVINELAHANGRTGMGAVMGDKRLKAVVCVGDESSATYTYADPESLKDLNKKHRELIRNHMPSINFGKFGTTVVVTALNNAGMLPTRNWRSGVFAGAEKLGWAGYEKVFAGVHTCYKCGVACKRTVNNINDIRYGGPEYETLASFGSFLDISDLDAVCLAHEKCNAAGLDTISAGVVIAFAMELAEQGILTPEEMGGELIRFGDAKGMLRLLDMIITRQGLGDILAEGLEPASKKIGRGAEKYNYTVKGVEPAMHDPRGKTGVAIGYAVSPMGPEHAEIPHEPAFQGEGAKNLHPLGLLDVPNLYTFGFYKARYAALGQSTWSMNNCLGICNFVIAPSHSMPYNMLVEVVAAITGWQSSLLELIAVGERSITFCRFMNNAAGMSAKDDRLIDPLFKPLPEGPLAGKYIDQVELEDCIKLYYDIMGWDEEGKPRRGTLHRLNLAWLIGE